MRCFKKLLIIILAIPIFNIILIFFCNGLIEGSWWKYSRGADFKDRLEFDEKMQAKGVLIKEEGKIEKIILLYFFEYMIISDKKLTNWTYYVRKGEKYDPETSTNPQQVPREITGTPGDKKLLDSLMKNKR